MSFSGHFTHPERTSYELSYLLRSLPHHLHGAQLSNEQCDMAEAAANHASIVASTLLSGLESMGRIMWSAGVNTNSPAEPDDFANIGMLVTAIAVQLQFLSEFRGEVEESVERIAQKGAAE